MTQVTRVNGCANDSILRQVGWVAESVDKLGYCCNVLACSLALSEPDVFA